MSRLCGIDYTAPSGRLLWGGLGTQGVTLGCYRLAFQAGIMEEILNHKREFLNKL